MPRRRRSFTCDVSRKRKRSRKRSRSARRSRRPQVKRTQHGFPGGYFTEEKWYLSTPPPVDIVELPAEETERPTTSTTKYQPTGAPTTCANQTSSVDSTPTVSDPMDSLRLSSLLYKEYMSIIKYIAYFTI